MSEVIVITILAAVMGAIMIAVIVAVLSQKKETPPVPVKVTPVKKEDHPVKKTEKTTHVSLYQFRVPTDRVLCRCCDTENWPQAKFCDTCGQPL